ncbi:MAG TPA: FAD-dependent oxidoreductase, partial [Steroidobacteraceae bacterium]|nr:FAD-dependent oxidoreductase [Steroidobacteraceae bacterium]
MTQVVIACPDIGNFKDVEVIDVLVKPGDQLELETPLITLETDKATMDVPASAAGKVIEVLVAKGGKVSQGTPIVKVETTASGAATVAAPAPVAAAAPPQPKAAPVTAAPAAAEASADRVAPLVVLGAGPGGYSAAFRAADLGLKVTLIERWATLGGVCLNVGCIPSKALLHAAKVIDDARSMASHGVSFGAPQIDVTQLRAWKDQVIGKLTGGLSALAKQRKVEVVRGTGRFISPNVIEVTDGSRTERIRFEQCIIAVGSESMSLPFLPSDPRVIDSTGALELGQISGRLLVLGGGIIGLEMACVYEALGAKVSVVELTAQLMPGCDPDLVRPLEKRIRSRYEQILLGTQVTAVKAGADGLQVTFQGKDGATTQRFDRVLVAVGRSPNGRKI